MAIMACGHLVPAVGRFPFQSLSFHPRNLTNSNLHHHVMFIATRRRFYSSSSANKISMSLRAGIADLPNVGKSTPSNAVPEDALMGYIFGMERATEVAHCVWKRVIKKGDIVVDATCGNGHDTLAMLKMVKDDAGGGFVYGMDIQEDAIKSTLSLMDCSLDPTNRQHVKLFATCHSRMMEVLPKNSSARLVVFNLGYLPGGDKQIITTPHTTLLALEAAKEILGSGGLISVVVYLGHPGGREEFEAVQTFASRLAADDWVCSQIQLSNRPEAPVLVFMLRK